MKSTRHILAILSFLIYLLGSFITTIQSQEVGKVMSCNDCMVSRKEITGKQVGQEDCEMMEVELTMNGRKYQRVDMGISGTLEGYIVKKGNRTAYFTLHPEFIFPQAGNDNPIFHGIGRYEAAKGSSMTVLYPVDRTQWNGKMFVTAHGAGASFARGTLKAWDKNIDKKDPSKDISKYEQLMLEKGYAVAKTRRSTPKDGGDVIVTLDDGTVLENNNLTEQPVLILEFAKLARNFLKGRLGKEPSRTYWYGHSGGARPGRLVNYVSGLNTDRDGKPIIDAILADDSGAGMWQPVLMKDGKDILFSKPEERERFVKQIDVSHLLYTKETDETEDKPPSYASTNYLANKRINAKLLRDKGLANKHRMFEVHGVSHSGGEYLPPAGKYVPDGKQGDIQIIPMYRLFDALIDRIDEWVEKGIEPTQTKSDWLELGDGNRDGIIENPAVAYPEITCPLGVYYTFPPSLKTTGDGVTGFIPFDGEGLEPYDGRGVFVDMNQNGYRDYRETVTQAWQRLGLLKHNEKFSREKYVECVCRTIEKLKQDGLLNEPFAKAYLEEAINRSLPKK